MPPVELNFHITNLLPRKVESFSAVLNLKLFFINRYLLINFVQLTKANKRVTNEKNHQTEVRQLSNSDAKDSMYLQLCSLCSSTAADANTACSPA